MLCCNKVQLRIYSSSPSFGKKKRHTEWGLPLSVTLLFPLISVFLVNSFVYSTSDWITVLLVPFLACVLLYRRLQEDYISLHCFHTFLIFYICLEFNFTLRLHALRGLKSYIFKPRGYCVFAAIFIHTISAQDFFDCHSDVSNACKINWCTCALAINECVHVKTDQVWMGWKCIRPLLNTIAG